MRGKLAVILGAALMAVTGFATAAEGGVKLQYSRAYHAVVKMHGRKAPGRNIRRYGVKTKHGVRDATVRDLKRSTGTLHRMTFRGSTLLNPTAPYQPPAATPTLRATSAPLAAIRQCESGGDYTANTGNGFYGAYQFDAQTWHSVGGSGLPSSASPAEQDARAARLHAERGSAPWPVCGR